MSYFQRVKPFFEHPRTAKVNFALALLFSLYWLMGLRLNVYRYAALGAIYELLWLPMLLLAFAVPMLALIQLFRLHRRLRWLAAGALLLLTGTLTAIWLWVKAD